MKKTVLISILIVSLTACNKPEFVNNILPNPKKIETTHKILHFRNDVNFVVVENNENYDKLTNYLSELFSCLNCSVSNSINEKCTNIILKIDNNLSTEAYNLKVDKKDITISGGDFRGIFWGIQTLRQFLPLNVLNFKPWEIEIPQMEISDYPDFQYRGMHLDVCRHFFSVEEVKTYIDLLILHKFNTFHFHLTDDQGWRIEIKALPKLTEIGSQRKETLIKKNWGTYDGILYGGFFTQDEIREIVKYAEERFITVIPEIEMPGHALAALAAYPELGCKGENYETGTYWGVFDDVFCAGNDKTFKFLETVIDEVCELFPNSPYIHVGGDECPKICWKKCAKCQQRIKENNLKNEAELQSYFVQRMEKYINSKGKQIIGWDEILEGGIAANATIMSWQGETGGIIAARQKHNVIMTPNPVCYFDHYQSENKDAEPFAFGGFSNCEKILSWNPIPDSLSENEKKYIIGVQANLWSEYILNFKQAEYMVLPRMAALSEIAWNNSEKMSYSEFNKRIKFFAQRYDALNYYYAKHEMQNEIEKK
ncbi:MAG: beta-N-acetylhexosaminidase [Bacteroidales bacterium]|jgi:hexosaminidase|nr:beta-N-acetylhexosaminidase [Bacteroidales bacterium]